MTKIGIIGSRRRNTIKDKEIIEKQLLEIMDKNKLNKNNTLFITMLLSFNLSWNNFYL